MTDNTYRSFEAVVVKPEVSGGELCIQGSLINIAVILDSLAEGLSPKEITKHFPPLTEHDVRAAMIFAKGA
jgi:uncharacterized protein (DUF433 family)